MDRYPYIVIEGLDGTGKTTLRRGLFRLFQGLYQVTPLAILTTNFTAPSTAEDLVDGKYRPTPANRDRYLAALAADKHATATRLILPSLPQRPVIADRWLLSEIAFFSVKHDQDPKITHDRLSAESALVPDLTLVLTLDEEAAMERAQARAGDATRPDWDVLEIQRRVRETYQHVSATTDAFPGLGPVAVLDAGEERAHVLLTAWNALLDRGLLPEPPYAQQEMTT